MSDMGQGPSVQRGETTQMPRRFERDPARSLLTYPYSSVFLHQIYFLHNFCNVSLDVHCCRAVEIYGTIYVKSTLKTVKHRNWSSPARAQTRDEPEQKPCSSLLRANTARLHQLSSAQQASQTSAESLQGLDSHKCFTSDL